MAFMVKGLRNLRFNLYAKTRLSSSTLYSTLYKRPDVFLIPHNNKVVYTSRCFATQNLQNSFEGEAEHGRFSVNHHQKLDKALYKLDMDVRRTGRISLRDVQEIFEEVKLLGATSSTQSLLLLRCCGSLLPEEPFETRSKMVAKIWATLQGHGARLDVSHYNALLKVHLENEHRFSPTDFLADMESKQVAPNRVTYQRLISRYCQDGDIVGASKILSFMKEKDLPISEMVFNSLIQGHARANDLASARAIFDVMRTAKLEPTADTYTMLLCALAEKGLVDDIREALQDAEKNEIFLLDRDYLDIVYSLATHGHQQYIDEFLDKTKRSLGYNQDAASTILMLVNAKQDDAAYKLLLTMPRSTNSDGSMTATGVFFIRQLVHAGRPVEKIATICQELKEQKLNSVGLLRAAEVALLLGKIDHSEKILSLLKEEGVPIRPHYFWPIFIAHRKNKDLNGVYKTLQLMKTLDARANHDTFVDFVFPALNVQDPVAVVHKLKELDYSIGSIVGSLVSYFIMNNDLPKAVHLIKTYPFRLSSQQTSSLAQAYQKSKDIESTLQVLIKLSTSRAQNQKSDTSGQFLMELIRIGDDNIVQQLEFLLEQFKEKKLGISHSIAELIQSRLKDDVPEQVVKLLEELATSSLEPNLEALDTPSGMGRHPRDMSIDQLENFFTQLKEKNMSTRGLLRRLLFQNCRLKRLEPAMKIKTEMDESGFTYTPASFAQLMDLHVHHNLLDQALEYSRKMQEMDSNFAVDVHKVLNLAALLVKNGRFEEAISYLTDYHQKFGCSENPESLKYCAFRLLNAPADKGNIKEVHQLFNLILKCGYIVPSNAILGPLVKAHLTNDDLAGALDEFEKCCKVYRCTPWKNELFHRLIHLEDAEKLQKVVDLSTEIHGEMNTLYDLAFAFIECNQVRQARKIMETPGLRAKHQRLDSVCEKYLENNKFTEMEHLVAVTSNLFDVDRDRMYQYLIKAHIKENDTNKALGVWTTMQEEDVQPSDQTLLLLSGFLRKNGIQVPFEIPNVFEKTSGNPSDNLLALLKTENVESVLNLKQKMESDGSPLKVDELLEIIDLLLKKDQTNEALGIVKEVFDRKQVLSNRILKLILLKLEALGDVESIEYISRNISENEKRRIKIINVQAQAYLTSGRHLEFLEFLECMDLDKANDFPNRFVLGLMSSHPELNDRVVKLAEKLSQHGFQTPLNMAWIYFFSNQNYEKADAIFRSSPKFQEKLIFFSILRVSKEKTDDGMARRLVDVVKPTLLTAKSKGLAFSNLIEILCKKENTENALKVYHEAITAGLQIDDLNAATMMQLKNKLQKAGVAVPFSVPSNADRSSSSDSDSSDDDKK